MMADNVLHLRHCYLGDGSETLLWCEKWLHGHLILVLLCRTLGMKPSCGVWQELKALATFDHNRGYYKSLVSVPNIMKRGSLA